jgi:hypothetical protein
MNLIALTSDKPLVGEIHRRQRKIMVGAFSVPNLKAFLSQFQITASKARGLSVNNIKPAGGLTLP